MADTIESLRAEKEELIGDLDFYKSRSERYFEQYSVVCKHRAQIAEGASGLAEIYWESEVVKLKGRIAELEATVKTLQIDEPACGIIDSISPRGEYSQV